MQSVQEEESAMIIDDIEDGEILEDDPPESASEKVQPTVEMDKEDTKQVSGIISSRIPQMEAGNKNTGNDYYTHNRYSGKDEQRSRLRRRERRKNSIHNETKLSSDEQYGSEEDSVFVLGGSLQSHKTEKSSSPLPHKQDSSRQLEDSDKSPRRDRMANNERQHYCPSGENQKTKRTPSPRRRRGLLPTPPPMVRNSREREIYECTEKDRKYTHNNFRGRNEGFEKRPGSHSNRKGGPPEVCMFFSRDGKCKRGNECLYSHRLPPRKMEVCKFFLKDNCRKMESCSYMHGEFPCKYYHTGAQCYAGKNCKFSHEKLDEKHRQILLRHLETAPQDILGDFPKLSRDNLVLPSPPPQPHLNNREKMDIRIPSLFDIKVSVPTNFNSEIEPNPSKTPDTKEEYDRGAREKTPVMENLDDAFGDNVDEWVDADKEGKDYREYRKRNDSESEATMKKKEEKKRRRRPKEVFKHHSEDSMEQELLEKMKEAIERELENVTNLKFSKKKKSRAADKCDNNFDATTDDAAAVIYDYSHSSPPAKSGDDYKHGKRERRTETRHSNDEKLSSAVKRSRELADAEEDALSHLPKKQKELYLRIQQHQKDAVSEDTDKLECKTEPASATDEEALQNDINWYSSDEESTSCSPLETILRTIKPALPTTTASSSESPSFTNIFSGASTSESSIKNTNKEEEKLQLSSSQLANIEISSEMTELLSSIRMKTTNSRQLSILPEFEHGTSYTVPAAAPVHDTDAGGTAANAVTSKSNVDLNNIGWPNISSINAIDDTLLDDIKTDEIDVKNLPFKPIPIHETANEIEASITSHPPMAYKLIPVDNISRTVYKSMKQSGIVNDLDPRLRRNDNLVTSQNTAISTQKPEASSISDIVKDCQTTPSYNNETSAKTGEGAQKDYPTYGSGVHGSGYTPYAQMTTSSSTASLLTSPISGMINNMTMFPPPSVPPTAGIVASEILAASQMAAYNSMVASNMMNPASTSARDPRLSRTRNDPRLINNNLKQNTAVADGASATPVNQMIRPQRLDPRIKYDH